MNSSPSLRRRLTRLNVPAALLLLLLQRTPMLRLLVTADSGVLTAPVTAVLKSAVASLVTLGAFHSRAGAFAVVPGANCTVHASGAFGGTGEAIVEVYEIP